MFANIKSFKNKNRNIKERKQSQVSKKYNEKLTKIEENVYDKVKILKWINSTENYSKKANKEIRIRKKEIKKILKRIRAEGRIVMIKLLYSYETVEKKRIFSIKIRDC